MANTETFTLTRPELRRLLIAYNVDEKNIEKLFAEMEKAHRHINIVSFIGMLEKTNLGRSAISHIMRRFGMDDVAIKNAFEMVDEQKVMAESGRLYSASVDFGQ
ncbi:MAG: hypothetical protein M1559_00010 [Candidatus Marsarchaeota archaeon]|jgi:hypothetical protein|nr:hypothetical protein [Candidatus Marsarchaeota archaeon]